MSELADLPTHGFDGLLGHSLHHKLDSLKDVTLAPQQLGVLLVRLVLPTVVQRVPATQHVTLHTLLLPTPITLIHMLSEFLYVLISELLKYYIHFLCGKII